MNPLRVMNAYIMCLRNQVRIQRKEICELHARLGRLEMHISMLSRRIGPEQPTERLSDANRKQNHDCS